jgi:signal transduction histidine kinase
MPGVVWTTDLRLSLTTCTGSRDGRRTIFPEGDLPGTSLESVFEPNHPGRRIHREALAGRSGQFEFQRGGRSFACQVEPLRDPFGPVIGAIAAAVEITGLPRASDADRRRRAELERLVEVRTGQLLAALREIDALAYAIGHELRSPLRTIASGAQIILEGIPGTSDEARDWAGRIAAAANRMDAMVLGLLDYTGRAAKGMKPEAVELSSAIHDALHRMGASIADAKAKVTVDGPLPAVFAHPRSLEEIIVHLVSNALKFVDPGVVPKVRLRADRRGENVRLWVDDNGIGIAPEHQLRLFGMFERLQPREKFGGAGMGLAVAKRLAERMGGTIGVKSESGRGSSFFVDLPGA